MDGCNCQLNGTLSVSGNLSCSLSAEAISGILTVADSIPTFSGETVITPSPVSQIVPCSGFLMTSDITINPVPSDYGRIAWNGVTLTVS